MQQRGLGPYLRCPQEEGGPCLSGIVAAPRSWMCCWGCSSTSLMPLKGHEHTPFPAPTSTTGTLTKPQHSL